MTPTCEASDITIPGLPIAGELCPECQHPIRLHSPEWGCRVGQTEQASPTEKRAVYCGCRAGGEV